MTQAMQTPGWGRANGFVDVGVSAADLSDAQVRDRLLVLDVVNRYGWSCDERDIDSLRRTFAEDAVIDGRSPPRSRSAPSRGARPSSSGTRPTWPPRTTSAGT